MDLFTYLIWRGLDAEILALQERLKVTVCSSIRACPDTQHAALAAEDMIDVAFARFRGVRPSKARHR